MEASFNNSPQANVGSPQKEPMQNYSPPQQDPSKYGKENLQPSAAPRQPEWFKSKLSEIGKRVIQNPSAVSQGSTPSGGNPQASLQLLKSKGIPGMAQGGRILKFQGQMRRNDSQERIGKIPNQILSRGHYIGSSTSHLENKKEISNFITNVNHQSNQGSKKNVKVEKKHLLINKHQSLVNIDE